MDLPPQDFLSLRISEDQDLKQTRKFTRLGQKEFRIYKSITA